MPAERIQRLLRLITLLQRDEPNTTESLMQNLGVSRRTLFRDLQTLEEAGVPHIHDRSEGYRIDKAFYLPPVNLTVSETLGLMLLGKSAVAQRDRPLIGSALSAIYKLIASVPDPIREACTDMMANVSVDPGTQIVGDKEMRFHALLQRSIDQCHSCRIVYQSPAEDEALHAVMDPYLLHFVNRAWYVFGYADVLDDVRMFKLARFSELEATEESFDPPENYRAVDKLGAAWRLIPEGKEHKIVLEFKPKVAGNVSEVRWHASQSHELLDDGRCRMTFNVDGLGEIAWWICGYADQVTVIKPPELRDRVEQMHRAAAALYAGHETPEVVTLAKKPIAEPKESQSPS